MSSVLKYLSKPKRALQARILKRFHVNQWGNCILQVENNQRKDEIQNTHLNSLCYIYIKTT
jgi:hypothetical protein